MRAFIFLVAAFFAGAAGAESRVSPELTAAIGAWLGDDDETALPALAALAPGDADAALLLEQIAAETPAGAQSGWLKALAADRRRALLSPGGAGGLDARAAEGDAVAAAIIAARGDAAGLEEAEALLAAGDPARAAAIVLKMLDAGRIAEVLALPTDGALYGALDYMAWLQGWIVAGSKSAEPGKWVFVSPAKGRAQGLILTGWIAQFVAADKPLPPLLASTAKALDGATRGLDGEARDYAVRMLRSLGRQDATLRPVGALCARVCPDAAGACILEALRRLGGYGAVAAIRTPFAPLIPEADFAVSRRAENMVARLVATTRGAKGAPADQCLSTKLGG